MARTSDGTNSVVVPQVRLHIQAFIAVKPADFFRYFRHQPNHAVGYRKGR